MKDKGQPMIHAPYPDYIVVSPQGFPTRDEAEQFMKAKRHHHPGHFFIIAHNNNHPNADGLWYVLEKND